MKELSEACGLSSMSISYYESGKRNPDMETIKKLASALGIRVIDFLSDRNENLVFDHREFRKLSKLSKREQEYVQESVEEYFSRFFAAVECLGGNPLPEAPATHSLKLSEDYHESAAVLRNFLGFQNCGPVDELTSVIENQGFLFLELNMDDDSFSGMNGAVNEYPYVVVNNNMRQERKRTTIVHELAHLMFMLESNESDIESMATSIAGAFLIPDEDLYRRLGHRRTSLTKDMELICQEYGISMFLLIKRANQAGIINDSLARDFYIKASRSNLRQKEPNRVKKTEKSEMFKRLVLRAINEEDLSIERASELLKVPCSELQEYCGSLEV